MSRGDVGASEHSTASHDPIGAIATTAAPKGEQA